MLMQIISSAGGNPTVSLSPNGISYLDGGNVGIGTTGPTSKLQLNGGGLEPDLK
jgi:uncharacterized protein YigE (DUF2233 family)